MVRHYRTIRILPAELRVLFKKGEGLWRKDVCVEIAPPAVKPTKFFPLKNRLESGASIAKSDWVVRSMKPDRENA